IARFLSPESEVFTLFQFSKVFTIFMSKLLFSSNVAFFENKAMCSSCLLCSHDWFSSLTNRAVLFDITKLHSVHSMHFSSSRLTISVLFYSGHFRLFFLNAFLV